MLPAKLVLNLAGGVGEADAPPISQGKAERGVALRVVATVEKALIPAAMSAVGVVGAVATHDAVLSAAAPIAVALAKADQLKEAVKKAREAAEKIYEAARELWKAAKITLERIIEIVVEAVARAVDYVKAHWFIFAAGLITYTAAQQLDFQLWQEHVAKFAAAIAGVPAFKKAELPLREKAPQVWEAVERFWEHGGREVLAELVDKLNNSGWLKEQAVKAVEAVKASEKRMISRVAKKGGSLESVRRVAFTWRDVAVAYALAEAAYRHLAPHMPDIEAVVKEVAEKLAGGKGVDVSEHYRQFRHFAERIREVVWILRARLAEIQLYAKELGLAEEEFEQELAEELARVTKNELDKLGEATLADKVVAFILGLLADAIYSRAVLWLAERGEGPRAMALTPSSAYDRFKKSKEGVRGKAEEPPFRAVLVKLLVALTALNLETVEIVSKAKVSSVEELLKLERGEIEITARVKAGKDVEEVRGVVEWEKIHEGGVTIKIRGVLLDFLKWEGFVREVEKEDTATDGIVGGWLVTDASVGEDVVMANTTSLFQAALYKASGLEEVKTENRGSVTLAGFKVNYHASSSKLYQLYLKIANWTRAVLGVVQTLNDETKKAVEENLGRLDRAKGAVRALVNTLLAEGKIAVSQAAGLSAEDAAGRIKKAASDVLSPEPASKIDPVEHQAYGRVYYPLMHLLVNDVSEVHFAQFFTAAIFGDGTITPYYVELTLGEFGPRSETLPYGRFHKLALWLAVIEKYRPVFEKYCVNITPSVYIGKNYIRLRFEPKAAGLLFALGGGPIWRVHEEYVRKVGRNLWDTGFIKAEEMLETVKKAFKDIRVRWRIDEAGERPVLKMRFVREADGEEVEIANLNVYIRESYPGKRLHAEFNGAREKAETLASILRAWGAEIEAKPRGKRWRVALTTGQLRAVEHSEFRKALETFVAKAKEEGLLTEEQAERKIRKVRAGPNAVEIAGVKFYMRPTWKETKLMTVEILLQTSGRGQFEEAVKALEEFGLVRDVDFTGKWDDKGKGEVWLKAGAFDKAVEALRAAGLREGEDFTAYRAKGGGGYINIKKPRENLEKTLQTLKGAGFEEGKDYTASSGRGYIRITIPQGLWTIVWMAKNGDEKAKEVLNQLLDVAKRLGIREYFEERIRLVLMAGTKYAVGKKMTVEGITVEITGFKVEWVSFKDKDNPCNWPKELCRPRVTIRYKIGDEEQEFTVTWGVGKKGEIQAYVNIENKLDKAAALIAIAVWEGNEGERNRIIEAAKRSGEVNLTLDNLVAMAQYDGSLIEWVMRIRKAGLHHIEKF